MNNFVTGLTIKRVSEKTGVSVFTLRAWERRYGVPRPARAEANRYRLYDEQDIADVLWMKARLAEGVSPSQASLLLQQRHSPPPALEVGNGQAPQELPVNTLVAALLESDEAAALRFLDEAFALYGPDWPAIQLIPAAMREVGREWQAGRISVWQEHLASDLIRRKLVSVRLAQGLLPSTAPRLVAACAPEEEHELGLQAFAILAGRHGWRVHYLGQRTPLVELARSAQNSGAGLVAISVSTVVGLASLVPLLDASVRPAQPLVFGGTLLEKIPALAERLPGAWLDGQALLQLGPDALAVRRSDIWAPSKKAFRAALALQEHRQEIAAGAGVPWAHGVKRRAMVRGVEELMIVDALVGACAFELPALLREHLNWLNELHAFLGDPEDLFHRYLKAVGRATSDVLSPESSRWVAALLER